MSPRYDMTPRQLVIDLATGEPCGWLEDWTFLSVDMTDERAGELWAAGYLLEEVKDEQRKT